MEYTKKPVTINAMEWTGDNKKEMQSFVGDAAIFKGKGLAIKTLEGELKATKGDMIICGVKGEFYPCKPDIFAETYDAGNPNTEQAQPISVSDENLLNGTDEPKQFGGLKTLGNTDVSGAKTNVPDIVVVGNGDAFKILCKASSQNEGWMKSTKAMQVAGGAVLQVTTQQRNPDGSYAVAEALTFVPGGEIMDDINGGRKMKGNR